MKMFKSPVQVKLVPARIYSGCFQKNITASIVGETKMYWVVQCGQSTRKYSKETGYHTGMPYTQFPCYKLVY